MTASQDSFQTPVVNQNNAELAVDVDAAAVEAAVPLDLNANLDAASQSVDGNAALAEAAEVDDQVDFGFQGFNG